MPAQSKKQQKFMGIVRAIQKGDAPASKFSKKARDAAKDMKKKDVDDFASTKHKGLPNKVKKEQRVKNLIKKMVREELENINEVDFDKIKLPSQVNRFLNKFVDSMKGANLNRIKRSAILYKVIDASGMNVQQLMADIQKIKKGLKEGKLTESQQIAKTILQQLGGNRFIAMTGAKNFGSSRNSLQFKIGRNSKGITHVIISLKSTDTYNVEFIKMRGVNRKVVKKLKGVYADQLGTMFKKYTGMNVRL